MAKELTATDIFEGGAVLDKLIEELEEFFPEFLPTPNHTLPEIMFRSGQRSVVEYIKQKLETDV